MVAERDGSVVGMLSAELIKYDPNQDFPWPSFDAVTDESYIRGTTSRMAARTTSC